MEKVKRKIEVTRSDYENLINALDNYAHVADDVGCTDIAARYNSLIGNIEDQIDEQGGFEE